MHLKVVTIQIRLFFRKYFCRTLGRARYSQVQVCPARYSAENAHHVMGYQIPQVPPIRTNDPRCYTIISDAVFAKQNSTKCFLLAPLCGDLIAKMFRDNHPVPSHHLLIALSVLNCSKLFQTRQDQTRPDQTRPGLVRYLWVL